MQWDQLLSDIHDIARHWLNQQFLVIPLYENDLASIPNLQFIGRIADDLAAIQH